MMKFLIIKHKQIIILSDDEEKNVPYAAGTTFHQSLKNQLNTFRFDDEERANCRIFSR